MKNIFLIGEVHDASQGFQKYAVEINLTVFY